MKKLDLARLAMSTKKVEFDFPGMEGFKVQLSYQSRSAFEKMREESKISKIDEESGLPYQEIDAKLYVRNYVKKVVIGWSGFKMKHLAKLILLDESQIEDMEEAVEFDLDVAEYLMNNSERFDNWVTQTIRKLDNFRK